MKNKSREFDKVNRQLYKKYSNLSQEQIDKDRSDVSRDTASAARRSGSKRDTVKSR